MPGGLLVPGVQHPHILFARLTSSIPTEPLVAKRGSHELKELVMTPKFLRDEAARFRGMSETVDREASKLRYLAMATDFEARAKAADELIAPTLGGATNVNPDRKMAKEPKAGI